MAPPNQQLPDLDIRSGINHSPHVVILGAGASRACCPNGDANAVRLPLMADFVKTVGIEDAIRRAGKSPADNFEDVYSQIHSEGSHDILAELDEAVRRYFRAIQLPDTPTIYDWLVLSLRPKDLIATFNWDPLLPQAFRRCRDRYAGSLPEIAFLHGNVDLVLNRTNLQSAFSADVGNGQLTQYEESNLLYPVAEKNYSDDDFVRDQWDLTRSKLNDAYLVSVIGYSAPKTDVEARSLLLNAWRNNPTFTLGLFEVVDVAAREMVQRSWSEFFDGTHASIVTDVRQTYLLNHPRRSAEALAFATLQQQPWHDDPLPNELDFTATLDRTQTYVDEENSGRLTDPRDN